MAKSIPDLHTILAKKYSDKVISFNSGYNVIPVL
jgi:hypothetical protein